MIGALISRIVRSRLPLLVGAGVALALVVWTWNVWPLAVWAPVWSLVLVAALVVAGLHDTGDGGE